MLPGCQVSFSKAVQVPGTRIHLAFGVTAQAKRVDYIKLNKIIITTTAKSAHNLCHWSASLSNSESLDCFSSSDSVSESPSNSFFKFIYFIFIYI